MFYAINEHVEELGQQRLHPIFLRDEAHLLHQDVLEHLHVLANYDWDRKPLLSIVLIGLPELWDRMLLRKNWPLWSRIHCRMSMPKPEATDTVEYIAHRLE